MVFWRGWIIFFILMYQDTLKISVFNTALKHHNKTNLKPGKPERGRGLILKISPGAYIFQRPFPRGLFLERLIFGGAFPRRETCVFILIELAL